LGARCYQDGHIEPNYANAERYTDTSRCVAPATTEHTTTGSVETSHVDGTVNEADMNRAVTETAAAASTDPALTCLTNCVVVVLAVTPSEYNDADRTLSLRVFVQFYSLTGELLDNSHFDCLSTFIRRVLRDMTGKEWASVTFARSAKRSLMQSGNSSIFEGNATSAPINTTMTTTGGSMATTASQTTASMTTASMTTASMTTASMTTASMTTASMTTARGSSGNLLVPSLLLFLGFFSLLFMVKA
jgi:hypothetical protein